MKSYSADVLKISSLISVPEIFLKAVFYISEYPFLIKRLEIYDLKNPAEASSCRLDTLKMSQKLSEYVNLTKNFLTGEIELLPVENLDLSGLGVFEEKILSALRKIKRGKTVSYSELAKIANYPPSAARAVGNLMKKNPFPLFYPCHRVIKSDGRIGAFSVGGGAILKIKLLELEKKISNIT